VPNPYFYSAEHDLSKNDVEGFAKQIENYLFSVLCVSVSCLILLVFFRGRLHPYGMLKTSTFVRPSVCTHQTTKHLNRFS
jgi:hypothetical protein